MSENKREILSILPKNPNKPTDDHKDTIPFLDEKGNPTELLGASNVASLRLQKFLIPDFSIIKNTKKYSNIKLEKDEILGLVTAVWRYIKDTNGTNENFKARAHIEDLRDHDLCNPVILRGEDGKEYSIKIFCEEHQGPTFLEADKELAYAQVTDKDLANKVSD